VSYDPGQTSPERIVETFNAAGLYRASIDRADEKEAK